MKKLLFLLAGMAGMFGNRASAEMVISPWRTLFKGIEHAVGTNFPDGSIPRLQVVHCLRVDLTDPDIQLFTTPPAENPIPDFQETLTLSVSNFLQTYGLAVATDANFYSANPGGSDPQSEGIPSLVFGLQICTGAVVSLPDTHRTCSILFTTNKAARVVFNNPPPGVSTAGIYTAITGYYPIVSNGLNVSAASIISYPDDNIHSPQPRTVHGLSRDRRYLFMMTIDGRQPGYSDNATDDESARWILQFGAWDAINMDGGGSTAMYMADCAGNPVPLNHSSYVAGSGRERFIGSHFGVYAHQMTLFITNVVALPTRVEATITWETPSNATTQVEYGLTPIYGSSTTLDSTPSLTHSAHLTGLRPGQTIFFRAISVWEGNTFTAPSCFEIPNTFVPLFPLTQPWRYTSNDVSQSSWTAPGYDDSTWGGPGPALLYIENNPAVSPKNTLLPVGNNNFPMPAYYFRTHFDFTGSTNAATLLFSNFLDDGAVFYLNGTEVYRLRMPPAPTFVSYSTLASAGHLSSPPCVGDAPTNCADIFSITPTSLLKGDNVLAVEAHNFSLGSPDIVFGSALFFEGGEDEPPPPPPQLSITRQANITTLSWTGDVFVVQSVNRLDGTNTAWLDVPGQVTKSPYVTTNAGAPRFFRLRSKP